MNTTNSKKSNVKHFSKTATKMLKSHFNLAEKEVEEEATKHDEEETFGEHDGEEYEPKIVFPERRLTKPEVSVKLSMLGKTADGDGYTYLKVSCTNLQLTHLVALKHFKHLQYVDVSENNLDLDALQVVTELPYIIFLQADKNFLTSAALKRTKYMQVIVLNHNKLTTVHNVFQPELSTFEAGYNRITKINLPTTMPHLKCLDFRYNLITDISKLNFPNLVMLYLAGNKIESLVGIDKLVNLRTLHLRNNPIRLLDGFDKGMTKLMYLNLRNCKVSTYRQVKKLKVLPALEVLNMKNCPYMGGTGEEGGEAASEEEDSELRIEVLATMPRLKTINKGAVTPEERIEAKELMNQWFEEGEKDDEEEVQEEVENESSK